MAVAFRENKWSRPIRRELNGSLIVTAEIHGQADVSPDLVTPAMVTGLPVLDSVYPYGQTGDPTMWAFSVTADYIPGSATASRIIIAYSNVRTWGGINPADPEFKGWDQDYYRVAQPIPHAVETNLGHRWLDNTGTMRFITEYPVSWGTFWESRKRFVRHVRIQNFNNAAWEPIGDMSNTLMRIYQRWYLFTLGSIQQTASNVWDTTYTFEFDPGTPDVLNNNSSNNLIIQYPGGLAAVMPPGGFPPPQAQLWARPPYHECSLVPGYNVATQMPDWPEWVVTCPYEVNENGWQQLPGFGPL